MTTDQEAENVAASVRHLLTQRGKDAENWQRQAKDWETTAAALRRECDDLARQLVDAQRRIAELEGEKKSGDFPLDIVNNRATCKNPHSHM